MNASDLFYELRGYEHKPNAEWEKFRLMVDYIKAGNKAALRRNCDSGSFDEQEALKLWRKIHG